MPLNPNNMPLGVFSLEAAEEIAAAIADAGAPPGGAAGDVQFNKGDGTFTNAAGINAACGAEIDGSGNMTFAAAAGRVSFVANTQYNAGATTITLNAGGDTTLILDSSTNPETITLDSDISGTKIFVGKSTGMVVLVGGPSASLGFFNATPITKPTVTGSKGGNVALASLITALANLGLLTDSTT